jgi:hypothetical protein
MVPVVPGERTVGDPLREPPLQGAVRDSLDEQTVDFLPVNRGTGPAFLGHGPIVGQVLRIDPDLSGAAHSLHSLSQGWQVKLEKASQAQRG